MVRGGYRIFTLKNNCMQTIIVTTDFSEPSLNAAKFAAALAGPLGADRIVLYHSYGNALAGSKVPATEIYISSVHAQSLQSLETMEKELRLALGNDIGIQIELATNTLPLTTGVEQLAEQWGASLAVAGATGKSGLERVFIGSSATSLASDIKMPLLIVPKGARYQPIDKIVFACDQAKLSDNTPVGEIGSWLKRLNARLLVLNVILEGKHFNLDIIPGRYKMHELLDGFSPEYHYAETNDDLAEEIEDFAKDHGAGLIISIPKSYGFFERLFRRSVSKRLARESDVPLLLLREREG